MSLEGCYTWAWGGAVRNTLVGLGALGSSQPAEDMFQTRGGKVLRLGIGVTLVALVRKES